MTWVAEILAALVVALLRTAWARADLRDAVLRRAQDELDRWALEAAAWRATHPVVVNPADPLGALGGRVRHPEPPRWVGAGDSAPPGAEPSAPPRPLRGAGERPDP